MSSHGRQPIRRRESKTVLIRVHPDLYQMIGDIAEARGVTAAELFDLMFRPEVERVHRDIQPALRRLREARDEIARIADASNFRTSPETPETSA